MSSLRGKKPVVYHNFMLCTISAFNMIAICCTRVEQKLTAVLQCNESAFKVKKVECHDTLIDLSLESISKDHHIDILKLRIVLFFFF